MKKKLYVIAIIITLVMSILVVKVNAADSSFTATMKSSSTSVSKGKEFTVTLKISNLNVGSKGLSELEGVLKYDDKVFEKVSSDNIEGVNGWDAQYSEDTGKIVLMNPSFCKEDTDVCKIALKTLSDTSSSKGTIEFTKVLGSNSESEISADDISLDITIGSSGSTSGNSIKINSSSSNTNKNTNSDADDDDDETETTTISANTSRNTSNKNANTNKENNTNTNNNKNTNVNKEANETEEDEMPNTGIDDTIVQAIILVALVAFLGYMKLKSLDKK